MAQQTYLYQVERASRLDRYLAEKTGETRSLIQQQIAQGSVQVDQHKITKAGHRLKGGERIAFLFSPVAPSTVEARSGPLDILYEDKDLLVLNKAQGIVVHPAPTHKADTLVHYLLHHLAKNDAFHSLSETRPGIVHRLDIGTSGVLAVAKNRKAQEALAKQFRNRSIKKQYRCLVWGRTPLSGKVESSIGRHRIQRQKMSSSTTKGRPALTHWQQVEQTSHFSYLKVFPHTGRTHQIRVHLSEMGHPIAGDTLYKRRANAGRFTQLDSTIQKSLLATPFPFLHAYQLTFQHPTTEETLSLSAPLPSAFDNFLQQLREFDKTGTEAT